MKKTGKVRVLLSCIILGLSMAVLISYGIAAADTENSPGKSVGGTPDSVRPQAASTAEPTPGPTVRPTVMPAAEEPADWQLIVVNSETAIPENYEFIPAFYDTESVDARIIDAVAEMLADARDDGINLWVASGFRDVKTQRSILARATENRMADYGMSRAEARADALMTIAEPGYSEHHTGLAVDFNTVSVDFEETEEYAWLQTHAAGYGFVQRYPLEKESVTKISAEPWHYRYVGPEHAAEMVRLSLCLEEYTDYLKVS